jgi:uncharacterized integral membrane protein
MKSTLAEAPAPEGSVPEIPAADLGPASVEPRIVRVSRHARGARLYASVLAVVALLVVPVVLASANANAVKLDWVFGSTHASLVWIVLAAAVFGWSLGIATAMVMGRRGAGRVDNGRAEAQSHRSLATRHPVHSK